MHDPKQLRERIFRVACRMVQLAHMLYVRGGVARLLSPQILSCGMSVGANFEEAQGAQSKRDFISKIGICEREARESLFRLRVLIACEIQPAPQVEPLKCEADELVAIFTTIGRSARRGGPARD